MYRAESEQRNIITLLSVGIIILVMAVIAIAVALNHSREDAVTVDQTEMQMPVETPAADVQQPQPVQIIEVEKPVVQTVPVPVPQTVIKEVPVPQSGTGNAPPDAASQGSSEASGMEMDETAQP